ncbi:MAG: MBL fold metallo-hydrolase [Steroidobacteraceae bacterium]|nr:MBL fold metallo-hydrolase [Steroidobacteraceae bacterium]MBP7013612.1 MBL fold metallo-hydrolase [Steroidobacteraceae bacterium]
MRAVVIPVTPFAQNCSLVWCPRTMEGAVIDPGGDLEKVLAETRKHGVKLTQILLTHAHIDHAGGTARLARDLNLRIVGPHPGDQFWIDGIAEQGRMFGFGQCESFVPDQWLDQGDKVRVGDVEFDVQHCPGHTPGHVTFHCAADKIAFVGDVLFAGSIGRTDFPGGDYDTLIRSIREKLFPLGDDVRFVPGHGPMSTFGDERRTNPFAGDAVVAPRRG